MEHSLKTIGCIRLKKRSSYWYSDSISSECSIIPYLTLMCGLIEVEHKEIQFTFNTKQV